MKQMRITYILMAVAALLVASCSSHDDDSVPMQTVTMPIKLAIPAEGFGTPTRATEAGDPGTFETFKLPQYLYVFLYSEYVEGTTKTPTVIYKKIDLTAGSSSQDDKQQYVSKYWIKEKAVNGDSLYTYNGDLSIDLPLQRTTGKVYVAASYWDLESGKTKFKTNDGKSPSALISEEDIKNLCFTVEDAAFRTSIQDLYSSPYNYKINKEYYGTLKDYSSKVPRIDMVLYHVAARVDISWNVAADTEAETLKLQKQLKITFQEPKYNYQTPCLLFRPMENKLTDRKETYPKDKYDLDKLITMNPGNHWYGRQVYYTIPYKYIYSGSDYDGKLLLNWRMLVNQKNTNGEIVYNTKDDKETSGKTITIGVNWPDDDVFVPSIRGVIRVKSNFTVNTTSSTE